MKHGHIFISVRYQVYEMWDHSDIDLWPPKCNHYILYFNWTFASTLRKLPQSILEVSQSQERDSKCEITVTLTFHLGPPKSDQFIIEYNWTLVWNLENLQKKKKRQQSFSREERLKRGRVFLLTSHFIIRPDPTCFVLQIQQNQTHPSQLVDEPVTPVEH